MAVYKELIYGVSNYRRKGSGWYFIGVIRLEIHTVEYKPLKGSSYIKLPDNILTKKAIINIKNKDNKCFMWSILRYLHPNEKNNHPERISDLKQYATSLNFKSIDFSSKIKGYYFI